MLVARSGLRKGLATSVARELVSATMCTNVIYGRSSIQGIIADMSKQQTFKSGYVLNTASSFIISSELAAGFVKDPQTQVILTDMYDSNYHAEWVNTLKKDGREALKEIYVVMLSATNEEHLNEFLDPASVRGGFIARTLIIKEDKKARINPLIDFDEDEVKGLELKPLVDYLRILSLVKGNFRIATNAKNLYKEWYIPFSKSLEETTDYTGTAERLHDHILKVAMLLSLSDDINLIIKEEHLQEAISLCTGELDSITSSTSKPGKGELSDKISILLDSLLKEPEYTISRKEILRRHYKDFDVQELGRMIDTLLDGGIIETKRSEEGPLYVLSKRYVNEISILMKKKKEE